MSLLAFSCNCKSNICANWAFDFIKSKQSFVIKVPIAEDFVCDLNQTGMQLHALLSHNQRLQPNHTSAILEMERQLNFVPCTEQTSLHQWFAKLKSKSKPSNSAKCCTPAATEPNFALTSMEEH